MCLGYAGVCAMISKVRVHHADYCTTETHKLIVQKLECKILFME